MLRIRGLAVIILIAGALVACDGPEPGAAAVENKQDFVRSELLQAENSDTAMGELFRVLREAEPELYGQFIDIVGEEIARGKQPFEAGAAARPLYLARFLELAKTAKDEDVNALLAFSREQMNTAMAIDPLLCVNLGRGQADKGVEKFSPDMVEREIRLMARVIRAGEQSGAAAAEEEVSAWMVAYVEKHPEMTEGLMLFETPSPTRDEATKICSANLTLLDGLLAEEPALRARLFRGTLAAS